MRHTEATKKFCEWMGIDKPFIMAPMFLVSNTDMIKAGLDSGVTGAIPALNYRTDAELRNAIAELKKHSNKPFGINLIVNKSNPKYKSQLSTIVEVGVDFIITSLGSPEETIKQAKPKGIKVFCDVVDLKYAKKVEALGADAIIAVNNKAGGHAGPTDRDVLIKELIANVNIPVISAGGVSDNQSFQTSLDAGAAAVSVGTVFIASEEAGVSNEYKQACVDYGAKDIVMTSRMSGSPMTVINTPYVQKIGTKASFMEKLMKRYKFLKKYAKFFIFVRGMKKVQNAAFKPTYKTVWCAGPSIENVKSIRSVRAIIDDITNA